MLVECNFNLTRLICMRYKTPKNNGACCWLTLKNKCKSRNTFWHVVRIKDMTCYDVVVVCLHIYLHKTERMTFVPCVLRWELISNAGWIARHPNVAWLSWAVGRNLIVLVTVLHPVQTSLEVEDSVGDVTSNEIMFR